MPMKKLFQLFSELTIHETKSHYRFNEIIFSPFFTTFTLFNALLCYYSISKSEQNNSSKSDHSRKVIDA